jgi:hypothetical protein
VGDIILHLSSSERNQNASQARAKVPRWRRVIDHSTLSN